VKQQLSDWPSRWPVDSWENAWEIAFPRPYAAIVSREAAQSGIEESLVYAIMREESEFDPDVTSWADAYGLMQLIVPTARSAAKGTNLPSNATALKRPSVNIALGCRVLGGLMKQFDSEALMAIAGYNAGPGRPQRWKKERPSLPLDVWVEAIPFTETRGYVKRVLASKAAYQWLYSPETRQKSLGLPLRITSK
jgi:soluble lytic murein transglycosylase